MIFTNEVWMRGVIFVLGLYGFWVARHIYKHKKPDSSPLVCPMNMDCHGVIHSDYSKFMGVPVEILGMLYYAFISLAYLLLFLAPSISPTDAWNLVLVSISCVALLFSVYLVGVQLFALRKGCFWCFVSALLCIIIFILTIFASNFGPVLETIFK